ncbi:MAG: YidC/Oxa1 family membrane protein insertase [Lachnospiraceae bacterium]|nr:YidC/Oxa1 family membrane protein insertase [Lachnospiraceae bacterium]
MLLTKVGGFLKPFAAILGFIMDKIFAFLNFIGIPNIGLAIILFTIVVYGLMIPLTAKQQKFSKLNAKMAPELQFIREKYQGKTDQDSIMRMQMENKMVYKKYGVNPSGSCIQLLIQMPILFALYRVIYSMPAYVAKIKEVFIPIANGLLGHANSVDFIKDPANLSGAMYYTKQFGNALFDVTSTNPQIVNYTTNTYIDVLNRSSTAELLNVSAQYPDLASTVADASEKLDKFNNFLGLNISSSPKNIIAEQFGMPSDERHVWVIILAILIPLLAGLTQWINTKLMPQQPKSDSDGMNSMGQSMKVMNSIMPIMSIIFCVTLPAGMGLYWVAGAVVRSIIQIIVNKRLDKIDIDEMVKKNIEKENAKRAKKGLSPMQITQAATMNTKNVQRKNTNSLANKAKISESTDYYKKSSTAKPGSLASKAMMVKQYNEKGSYAFRKEESVKEEKVDDFKEVAESNTDSAKKDSKEV